MNLVDEENSAAFNVREETSEVSSFINHWSASRAHLGAHGITDNVGEGGLAEAGGAAQKNVLECVAALLGGFHHHLQALNGFILSRKFLKKRRAKGNLKC